MNLDILAKKRTTHSLKNIFPLFWFYEPKFILVKVENLI